MRLGLIVAFGPALLASVIPYTVWALFNGTYPVWQANRAAMILGLIVLMGISLLALLMRSVGKATIITTLLVCAALTFYLNLTVILIVILVLVLAALLDRTNGLRNANLATLIMGLVLFGGAIQPPALAALEQRKLVTSKDAIRNMDLSLTPSIIHIVLDGYGSQDTLENLYNYESENFFSALERRGFNVIRNATSPFSQTLPSMASVMSGGAVDLTQKVEPNELRRNLGFTIENGPVAEVLRNAGYVFFRSKSGYGYLDHQSASELNSNAFGLTELEANLFYSRPDMFGQVHNKILKAALEPGTLHDMNDPYFYYQHVLAPHPPFSVNADGSARSITTISYSDGNYAVQALAGGRDEYIVGYREKAHFVEDALLRQIDAFPVGPKIVLIHGDHGPGALLNHESAEETCMSERLTTFMAFYSNVPNVTFDQLAKESQGLSIVNAYRAIFSQLSEVDIPLLKSPSWYLPWSDPAQTFQVEDTVLSADCER